MTRDYDVIVVGSGFGGSVTAMRAAEKGYSVGVMESGRRIPDSMVPKTDWNLPHYLWFPGLELYGIQRLEVLDDTFVMAGAGVGGGSHVWAGTCYVPAQEFFDAPEWKHITDWGEELAPFYELGKRMLGVAPSPYYPNEYDRAGYRVAKSHGREDYFNLTEDTIFWGEPGVEVDDPYFGGVGPRRTGCINCGNCMTGCGHNAKNKLNVNYLALAETRGVQVHELQEVYEIEPLDEGGYRVHARHPGWAQRAVDADQNTYTCKELVISAHAYGTAKLLTHMHAKGNLAKMSDEIGKKARTNSEQLVAISTPHDKWKEHPTRYNAVPGTFGCTSAVWPDDLTSCEPCFYGVGNNIMALMFNWHTDGSEAHPLRDWAAAFMKDPGSVVESGDPRSWSQRTAFYDNSQTRDDYLDLYWDDGLLHSRQPSDSKAKLRVHVPQIENFMKELAKEMGLDEQALVFERINRNASAHFLGGMCIGDSRETGVIDPYLRAYGYEGLHVIDGSFMPANPGVNPTLTIVAMAERALSMWPNKGDEDQRPSMNSSYKPVKPIMPHNPIVPKGAHGELRLTATKEEMIPKSASDFGGTGMKDGKWQYA